MSDLNSEFDEFVRKFGSDLSGTSNRVALVEELLWFLNEKCNNEGGKFLVKAVECERMDVVRNFLMFDEVDLNAKNEKGERAVDIAWEKKNYECMLILLDKDSVFPSEIDIDSVDESAHMGMELRALLERRVLLHSFIRDGVLSSVKELVERENSLKFYSPKNVTALYCAIENEKYEIYAYLLSMGITLGEEEKYLLGECNDFHLEKFQIALEDYFIPFEDSHISKLISVTKLLGNFTGVERRAVKDIFEWLNVIPFTRFLMKAVQYEKIEIIFDFNSELVDRVYPELCSDKIYGLYVTNCHRIYIGAKNCTLNHAGFRDVAGTVAHELCHRAMQMIFNNHACPYSEGCEDRIIILKDAHKNILERFKYLLEVETTDEIEAWEKVLSIYLLQPSHAELIVRVPQILCIYGEEKGKKLLSEKMPELLRYYTDFIHKDLVEFTDLPYFSKPLCSIQTLSNVIGILSEEERCTSPFITLTSYEDYTFELNGLSILLTSNPRLCMLNVYHCLKQKFTFHMEKKCLFTDLKELNENLDIISKVSQNKIFYCLVLVWRENDTDIKDMQYITDLIGKDKKVILIANNNCKQLLQYLKEINVLHYPWNSLKESFKNKILDKIVSYQGVNEYLFNLISAKAASEIIDCEVLSYLMEEKNVSIGPKFSTQSPFYSKSLYIPRNFNYCSYKSMIENLERRSYYLLITGLQKTELKKFKLGEELIHELKNGTEFQPDKPLILSSIEDSDFLFHQEYLKNTFIKTGKTVYWLHHENRDFCLQYACKQIDSDFLEEEKLEEEDLAMKIVRQRLMIVADDPGAGKSTVISSLMNIIRRRRPYIFLGRINLNELAVDTSFDHSLHRINNCFKSDDILKYIYNVLGLKSSLEYKLIHYLRKIDRKIIIMFDSFDEIIPLFKENVMKLLRILKDETKIHIVIFTRTHEKCYLEKEMCTSAISLCPFSYNDQMRFLNNFWCYKLGSLAISNEDERIQCRKRIESLISVLKKICEGSEYPKIIDTITKLKDLSNAIQCLSLSREKLEIIDRMDINELDFKIFSAFVLQNVNHEKLEKSKPLTSLPLHLYMVANIIYNEYFTVRIHVSIFNLYFDFLDSKIKTYLREKCQMKSETTDSKIIFDILREVILNTLTNILGNLHGPNQKESLSQKDVNYLKIIQRIGLIKEEKGYIHFIHITIQEFVFFTLIKENIKSDTLDAELFSEILFKEIYQRTIFYLDSFFQTDDAVNVNFSSSFLKKFDASKKFIDYLNYYGTDRKGCSFIGCYIWKKILNNLESLSGLDEADKLSSKIVLHLKKSFEYDYNLFEFLTLCLNDQMLIDIFERNASITAPFISSIFIKGSLNEVCSIIKMLNMVVFYKGKTATMSSKEASTELMLFNINLKTFLRGNVFHWISKNKDANCFLTFLKFAMKLIDRKTISGLLTEHDNADFTILHHASVSGNRNILTILEHLEIYLKENDFHHLLSVESNKKLCFLKLAAYWNSSSVFYESLIEYLVTVMDDKILREIFLQRDCNRSNILHFAVMNKNKRIFKITAKMINEYLEDEEFVKFICARSYFMRTILHVRSEKCYELKDLKIVKKLIGNEKFIDLLMAVDEVGGTCAHAMCGSKASLEVICSNISFFAEVLDEDSLKRFMLILDGNNDSFLHILANKYKEKDISKLYLHMEHKLSTCLLKEILNVVNNFGEMVKIENDEGKISIKIMRIAANTSS